MPKKFLEKLRNAIKISSRESEDEIIDTADLDDEPEIVITPDEEGELAIDMYQTPNAIVIKTMVAGVKPEDLDVSITRDMVTIRGERQFGREEQDGEFFHQELYWGSFSRTIVLPAEIEIEEAEAKENHGLLILTLPKIDKNRQSKLKVKTN